MASVKSSTSMRKQPTHSSAAATGMVDEETFRQAFKSVSSLPIYSSKDMADYIKKVKDSLSVNAEDWERRVDALQTLRSVVAGGSYQMEDFYPQLRTLEQPVEACLRDLRSQVVRESCVTVAYLSQELGIRFDHFAEVIMPTLLNLIPNSAKIMSTSGIQAVMFIIKNTHAARLLPIIVGGLSSKSNVVRRYVCEFLDPICQYWPVNVIDKYMGLFQESLRKGISDADQDARSASRRAFQSFAMKFPDESRALLQNLEPAQRKMIEKTLSADASSDISAASSRTASQTNLASRSGNGSTTGTGKRPNRPLLGSAAAASMRRPNVAGGYNGTSALGDRARPKIGLYAETRGRSGQKVSQSQPASREASPSSRAGSEYEFVPSSGYGRQAPVSAGYSATMGRRGNPFVTGGTIGIEGTAERRRPSIGSRLPRSQGPSRDTSPTSITGGSAYNAPYAISAIERARRASGSTAPQRPSISCLSDVGYSNHGINSHRSQYESDDNASETSSMCSERSGRSVPTYRRRSSRTVSGINDIINLLRSPQWAEKKDGLVNLQNFLRSGEQLSQPEVNRLADVLSSIFGDSSSKVLSLFMDTLQLFMKTYHPLLHDWVYVALVRLLSRQGHEVLSSHQRAIKETLTVLRSTFPLDLQFFHCCRFIIDDALTPAPKVKVCMLEYIKDLLVMMPSDALCNPPVEVVKAITRIITWSTEPKSAEVRRLASRVIIKMSDLNSDNFTHLIQQIPRGQQEQASKLLKTYQKTSTAGGSALAPDGGSYAAASGPTSTTGSSWYSKSGIRRVFSMRQPKTKAPGSSQTLAGRAVNPITAKYVQQQAAYPPGDSYSSRGLRPGPTPDGQLHDVGGPGNFQFPSQHMQQQPQYHQHHLSSSNTNGNGADNGHNHFPMVAPSPLYSPPTHPPMPGSPTNSQPMLLQGAESGFFTERSPLSQSGCDQQDNSPVSRNSRPPSLLSGFDRANEQMLPEDALTEILQELSNYNERYEQRKACMLKLIKLLRDGSVETWEEHSKPTLLILLESLSDNSGDTRALALRVLQELVRTQGELIREYACLTVMKILEACKDSEKAVVRSAEECAQTVARYLPEELCLRLLTTVILDTRTELNLPAVKMQTQVIKVSSPEAVAEVLPDLIPGLISGCSHEDSAVRKASIFCLVQLALKFGDNIWPHLEDLAASKKRLLRVYIDKELQGNNSSESLRIS
uniref:TOG domain-containing protein n=1 Tax=Schistocephalus solidus TaxID=70667 RepID=A0A0X3P8A4_SCHSO